MGLYHVRVPVVRQFKRNVWAWLTSYKFRLVKAAVGRGRFFAVGLGCWFWCEFPSSGEANGCCSCASEAEEDRLYFSWRRRLQQWHQLAIFFSDGSPWGSDSCPDSEVAHTTNDLQGRSQKRLVFSLIGLGGGRWPGHNLTQLASTLGAARCFSQRRQALYSLHLLWTGSVPRSLVIYGFLTNKPGRCCGAVSPGGQPERTRDVKKLKLLLDGDSRQQNPTHTWSQFLCSVPHSGFPGFDPSGNDELGKVGLIV